MDTCQCYNDNVIDSLFTEFKQLQFQRDQVENRLALLPDDTEVFLTLKVQLGTLLCIVTLRAECMTCNII